jgi:hypothetical protein
MSKLQHPLEFLSAVYNYELVGPTVGFLVALAIPWIELVLGVSLILALCVRGGLALSVVLLSVFLGV